MEYSEYLKDKSVAIVGSSSHLIGQKQGNFIDSHDVVVRISNSSILPEELEEDFGKRCDVVYTWHSLMRYNKPQEVKLSKVKYVFMSHGRHKKGKLPTINVRKDEDWLKSHEIPYEIVDVWHYRTDKEFAVSGHGGFIAMYHLLLQQLSSLYVTGVSFHREGTIEVGQSDFRISPNTQLRQQSENPVLARDTVVWQRKHFERDEDFNRSWFKAIKGTILSYDAKTQEYTVRWQRGGTVKCKTEDFRSGHNPVKEESLFFEWVAKDDRIKLDDYLQNLRSSHLSSSIT